MKRFLFCLLAIGLCSASAALADENVRAAQSRLKDGGFYFGDVNGTFSSETAAAVTRYQIRNGLQISGQLDAATAKSLGVKPGSAEGAPQPPAQAETWNRLRRADQQFLRKLNAAKPAPTPRAEVSTHPAAEPAPPSALAPADAAGQTFTLSRERLRDYVGAFVLAGLNPTVGSELEFFGDRVRYFNEGIVEREQIRRDLQQYNQRWPERRFWLAGQVEVEPRADSRLRVTFPLRFDLRNGAKHSAGRVRKTLVVEVAGDDLQIVGVNEQKAR
ncbi:MAG: peptidoglycan-binding domain-containing protein [Chthoniobacterales bacterium]